MCETFNITARTRKKTPAPRYSPCSSDSNCSILLSIYTRLCFPGKYFFCPVSLQICHSVTQRRNASVRHYRDGAFQSFVHGWLFGAAASKRPFFISHLVVWGATARPSQSIAHIPAPRPPPSPLDRRPFSKGTCTLFNVRSPRRQCPT